MVGLAWSIGVNGKWKYSHEKGNRKFEVKPQPISPIETNQGISVHGAKIEFSHDIFGYAGRTLFHVILDQQVDIATETGKRVFAENDKVFINDAVMVVNRFLEIYRDQDKNSLREKSFHIIPIVVSDILDIRIVAIGNDNLEKSEVCVRIPRLGKIVFGSATERSSEVIREITNLLKDGTTIPIYRELLSSSMNAIWRGQYRVSPIESNTSFEAFVAEITKWLEPTTTVPQRLFSKLVLLESSLNQKLTLKSLPEISWFTTQKNGWKSLLNPVLLLWKSKCYELRHKVIHEGYSRVTLSEARDAQDAVLGAIQHIQSLVQRLL